MTSDIQRYAHGHAFPNGNAHRHVHEHESGHVGADVNVAHPGISEGQYYFLCVDCEPHRAQSAAVRDATVRASGSQEDPA